MYSLNVVFLDGASVLAVLKHVWYLMQSHESHAGENCPCGCLTLENDRLFLPGHVQVNELL